jgi:hypothetical protein
MSWISAYCRYEQLITVLEVTQTLGEDAHGMSDEELANVIEDLQLTVSDSADRIRHAGVFGTSRA